MRDPGSIGLLGEKTPWCLLLRVCTRWLCCDTQVPCVGKLVKSLSNYFVGKLVKSQGYDGSTRICRKILQIETLPREAAVGLGVPQDQHQALFGDYQDIFVIHFETSAAIAK